MKTPRHYFLKNKPLYDLPGSSFVSFFSSIRKIRQHGRFMVLRHVQTRKGALCEAERPHGWALSTFALVVAGTAWLLAGCIPTAVYPFYRAGDVINDPALLGVWKDKPDGKEHWSFTAGEDKSYNLEIRNEDQQAVFVAHLFKLGNERFLDIYPTKSGLEEGLKKNPYGALLIPTHLCVRVRATDPALRMSCLEHEWLTERLKRDPKTLAHVLSPDGRVVLTGETEVLQAFIKHHLDDTNAWNEMYEPGLVKAGGTPKTK